MSHQEQREYVQRLKEGFPDFFSSKRVLEIGSLDINGSLRSFFTNCDYIGIDVGEGPGVDIVCQGQEYDAPDKSYDVVCSAECFEHNPYWLETFKNMIRLCKSDGLIFFTCASDGRSEHGTTRTSPADSPLTVGIGWDYYKNLNVFDFVSEINFYDYFSWYGFEYRNNSGHPDLYFFGITK